MPSKTVSPRWVRPFLRALGESANVQLSARAAGIARPTAYKYRSRSPDFAKSWVKAMSSARDCIASEKESTGLKLPDGREGIVRLTKNGGAQIVLTSPGGWNAEVEDKFFTALAATGNVMEAARQINMAQSTLYRRRKMWPAFDARWDEVISLATERLAVHLLTSASNVLEPPELPVPELEPMSVDQAIRVAQIYEARRRKNGELRRYHPNRPPVDVEAVKEEIIRKAKLLSGGKRL